jgi:hypothetical protein
MHKTGKLCHASERVNVHVVYNYLRFWSFQLYWFIGIKILWGIMATKYWVPLAYPVKRHISQVWSVPQGLSSLSPPGHSRHSQGKGKQLTPTASPASSCCCTQSVLHLLPWLPLPLSSSPAAETEDLGTYFWIFSISFLSSYWNLNHLEAWSKSGTVMVGIFWMNIGVTGDKFLGT